MNMKDLEYLRKMNEEASKRAFSKDEIEEIHNCLRTNVGKDDTNEALDLSASIADAQVVAYGADVDSLLDTILYHGGLKGAEDATKIATDSKFLLAAKFVDSGQYDKFEKMSFHHLDKEQMSWYIANGHECNVPADDNEKNLYVITDYVRTLKGLQYLEQKGKIPEDYFTKSDMLLLNASNEQIDFYISHKAPVNDVDDVTGETVLDRYLYNHKPTEAIEKLLNAGAKPGRDAFYTKSLLSEYFPPNFHNNDEYTKYTLQSFDMMLEKGINPPKNFYTELSNNEELREKYPALISKIISHSDPLKLKMDMLREKLGNKVGKTDKYSDDEEKTHIDTAKNIMMLKSRKRGDMVNN